MYKINVCRSRIPPASCHGAIARYIPWVSALVFVMSRPAFDWVTGRTEQENLGGGCSDGKVQTGKKMTMTEQQRLTCNQSGSNLEVTTRGCLGVVGITES